ncbi:nuclear transport factor 2 family protein [Undibacterium sp. TJN19]|uniref:nuclear transport factor 2 family protein n=1 Tax=Undibacterium sp. TJN19 TaxID=3413055 RepID=UPI003BF2A863
MSYPATATVSSHIDFQSHYVGSAEDKLAIERLLSAYTTSVSTGDGKTFATLLLDDKVPFMAVRGVPDIVNNSDTLDTRRYADFRESVFGSGRKLEQAFFNVKINQDGALAQVSLDFITKEAGTQKGGFGWKLLQLLKTNGHWKIASEFYTVRPLPLE